MTAGRPTILCINHWHDDNKGDSAITTATLNLLRRRWPTARIRVVTTHEANHPVYRNAFRFDRQAACEPSLMPTEPGSAAAVRRWAGRVLPDQLLTATGGVWWLMRLLPFGFAGLIGRPPRAVACRLAGVDLVVMIGGSNIYDNPAVAAPFSLARLFQMIYPALAAEQVGIPVVFFGHTFGPFPRSWARRLASRVLRNATAVSVRDTPSSVLCRELGVVTGEVPDVAFALQPCPSSRTDRVLDPLRGSRLLGLVIREHPHLAAHETLRVHCVLVEAAQELVAADVVDAILIVPQAIGPIPAEDDRATTKRLAAALSDVPSVMCDDDLSPAELAVLYGRCRVVVAVRLHAAILALVGGAPAFAVSYFTTKAAGVSTYCGSAYSWRNFVDVTATDVVDEVHDLVARDAAGTLAARVREVQMMLTAEVASWPLAGSPG